MESNLENYIGICIVVEFVLNAQIIRKTIGIF